MGLLCPIIGILISHMNGFGDQLPVSYSIAPQLVCHDLPGFAAVTPHQSLEEPFGRRRRYHRIHDVYALVSDYKERQI
jgi:hypothetical protein